MKIEKSTYQGYLWYSNAQEPEVYNNEECELEIDEKTNPFVIEGQLFDGKVSINIRYVDGEYVVKKYTLSELEGLEYKQQTFFGNRMKDRNSGFHNLVFRQYWREQKDENCEGMKVLRPAELVFVGFEYIKEE